MQSPTAIVERTEKVAGSELTEEAAPRGPESLVPEGTHLDRLIDFIICLGGDGTILWVSNLFPRAVPPVVSFAMGSLGFLTAFAEESIPKAIDDVVGGGNGDNNAYDDACVPRRQCLR